MPLQTTFRPKSLDEIVGNEVLIEELKTKLNPELNDLPHMFLITGPSGCGKTTIARIIRQHLGCSDLDFFQFNASNTRGIDTVREVLENMNLSPMNGKVKVYFFDECHQLTGPAQEALLKETEEPPAHVYFIFCTTEPEKLKETFKRRALQLQVQKLIRGDILNLLRRTLKQLDREDFFPNVVAKIAMNADGSAGQAMKLLDSVLHLTKEQEALKAVEITMGSEGNILELSRILVNRDVGFSHKWLKVMKILKDTDVEPEVARRAILTYMEKVMLGGQGSDFIVKLIDIFEGSVMYSFKAGLVAKCYVACKIEG